MKELLSTGRIDEWVEMLSEYLRQEMVDFAKKFSGSFKSLAKVLSES
jgi:hypothetical protein